MSKRSKAHDQQCQTGRHKRPALLKAERFQQLASLCPLARSQCSTRAATSTPQTDSLMISAAHVTACAHGSNVVKGFDIINHAVQTSQSGRSDLRQSERAARRRLRWPAEQHIRLIRQPLQTECVHGSKRGSRLSLMLTSLRSDHSNGSQQIGEAGSSERARAAAAAAAPVAA
jgi:hypothetical protein